MQKGRSIYTFQLVCDITTINNLIQSWLQANCYSLENKNGEAYYKAGDAMIGYRYFSYSIVNQTLNIYAWLKGAFGDLSLEQNSLNMPAMNYRNSLNTLFQEISKVNINHFNDMNMVNQSTVIQNSALESPNDLAQTFQLKNKKRCVKLVFGYQYLDYLLRSLE